MADLTAAQLTALGTEINADPKALGYAGKTVAQRTALINAIGGSAEKVPAGVIPSYLAMDAILNSELDALIAVSPGLPAKLLLYVAAGQINTAALSGGVGNTRGAFLAMFPNGTAPTSRANLIALVDRSASRAEVLFGSGVVVSPWDMGKATGVPS